MSSTSSVGSTTPTRRGVKLRLKQALKHSPIKRRVSKEHKRGNTYAATEQEKPEMAEQKLPIQPTSSSSSRPPPAGYLHNRGLTRHEARMLLLDKTSKVTNRRANLNSTNEMFSDLLPQRQRLSPIMLKDVQAHSLPVQRAPGSHTLIATRRKEKEPVLLFPQMQLPSNYATKSAQRQNPAMPARPNADIIPTDDRAHAQPSTRCEPKMVMKVPDQAHLAAAILAQPQPIKRRTTAAIIASMDRSHPRRESVRAGADRTYSAVHGSYVSID
jgi:hypothetical protein